MRVQQTEGTAESETGSCSAPQNRLARSCGRGFLKCLSFLKIFTNVPFALSQLAFFSYALGWITNQAHLPSRCKEAGWSDDQSATLLTVFAIAAIVTRVGHGWFVDKGYISVFKLLLSAQLGAAVIALLNPVSDSYAFLVGYAAVLGGCAGMSTSLLLVCVRLVVSNAQLPASMSWTVAACSLANATGSVFAGMHFWVPGRRAEGQK